MSNPSTQRNEVQTVSAGIDVGKSWLDVALADGQASTREANDAAGHAAVIAFLRRNGATRVALEASGGYEVEVWMALLEAGFEVHRFQPRQVRAYAKFRLNWAKSDRLDAQLIARCAAADVPVRQAPDPRLAPLAEHLTFIEQIEEDLARAKVRREHLRDRRLIAEQEADITRLKSRRKAELKLIMAALRRHRDLARRFDLLFSIEGIGERTALALVVRMPELGSLTREEAASLLGVAPFVHESGRYKGRRRTGGGRARARTALFAATQAACRQWNKVLMALYDRLIAAGKPHAVAVIACTRKLIIYANTVLARGTPWQKA
jgi:transposase